MESGVDVSACLSYMRIMMIEYPFYMAPIAIFKTRSTILYQNRNFGILAEIDAVRP